MLKFLRFGRSPDSVFTTMTAGTAAEIEAEVHRLDIDAAIAAEESWKARLDAYLAGKSTEDFRPEVICFDDRCELGKWLYGPGRARLGKYTSFKLLVAEHKNFHYHAANVVSFVESGRLDKAVNLLTTDFERSSARVVELLNLMKEP
jgi:hypothetical protein